MYVSGKSTTYDEHDCDMILLYIVSHNIHNYYVQVPCFYVFFLVLQIYLSLLILSLELLSKQTKNKNLYL
jgi:hypothetical protein